MQTVPVIALNDGLTIPQLGFGTYQIKPEDTTEIVLRALDAGYRHIDTAEMYGNEKEVGLAVKQSGIPRSEIFITSKLNNSFHEPAEARNAFEDTIHAIGSDYIDLFLIHWPLPTLHGSDYVSTWKAMEEFQTDGRAKSIGVSNFQIPHLEKLDAECHITPAVNQIELHPYLTNQALAAYNADHGIITEAWSPIAQGNVLDNPTIVEIAENLHKTPAQVVLRWHIQHGYVVFPKSSTPERIVENYTIFDFELSSEDMKQIDDLDKGEAGRTGPNPDTFAYIPQ